MDAATDRHGLEVLDLASCLTLLRSRPLGRLAYVDAGVPTVVLRALEGGKITALERGSPVAFQLDDHDPARGTGWSVLVQGRLIPVEEDTTRFAEELDSWAADDEARVTWVRLLPDSISGRRLRRNEDDEPRRSPADGAAGPAD